MVKKILVGSLIILTLAIFSVIFIFYTPIGNRVVLKPIVEKEISKNLPNFKFKISNLKASLNSIDIDGVVADAIKVKAFGPINWFKGIFALKYNLEGDIVEINQNYYKVNLTSNGTLKGKLNNFRVAGKGRAFRANIAYRFFVKDAQIMGVYLNAKNAYIEDILTLASFPPYAKGNVDIWINMPQFRSFNQKSVSYIVVKNALLNRNLIKRDFNIDIKGNEKISLYLKSKIQSLFIFSQGELKSKDLDIKIKSLKSNFKFDKVAGNIAFKFKKLSLNDILFNLKINKTIEGNGEIKDKLFYMKILRFSALKDFSSTWALFQFNTPHIEKISWLKKLPFRGKKRFNGEFKYKNKKLDIKASLKYMGGLVTIIYKEPNIILEGKNISLRRFLSSHGIRRWVDKGVLEGRYLITNRYKKVLFRALHCKLNKKLVNRVFKLDVGDNFLFNLAAKGKILNSELFSNININTTMGKLFIRNYILNLRDFKSGGYFKWMIDDLRRIYPLTGSAYRGSGLIGGEFKINRGLFLKGSGKLNQNKIELSLNKTILNVDIKSSNVKNLLLTFGYPGVLIGPARVKISSDISSKKGVIGAKIEPLLIESKELNSAVESLLNYKIASQKFEYGKFKGKVNNHSIRFEFEAFSPIIKINSKGYINSYTKRIDSLIKVEYDERELRLRASGKVFKPQILPVGNNFIIEKAIDKLEEEARKKKSFKRIIPINKIEPQSAEVPPF